MFDDVFLPLDFIILKDITVWGMSSESSKVEKICQEGATADNKQTIGIMNILVQAGPPASYKRKHNPYK